MSERAEYDGPEVTILRKTSRLARRAFVCDFCHRKRPPGSRRFYTVYIEDGRLRTQSACSPAAECTDIWGPKP